MAFCDDSLKASTQDKQCNMGKDISFKARADPCASRRRLTARLSCSEAAKCRMRRPTPPPSRRKRPSSQPPSRRPCPPSPPLIRRPRLPSPPPSRRPCPPSLPSSRLLRPLSPPPAAARAHSRRRQPSPAPTLADAEPHCAPTLATAQPHRVLTLAAAQPQAAELPLAPTFADTPTPAPLVLT